MSKYSKISKSGILLFLLSFIFCACDSNDEPVPLPEIKILSDDIIITRAEGQTTFDFQISQCNNNLRLVWEGPDANIRFDKISAEAILDEDNSSPVNIVDIQPFVDESGHIVAGRYTATVALSDSDIEGNASFVLVLTVSDSKGHSVEVSSEHITVTFGFRPKIYGISVSGIKAEMIDSSTFYVKLPYGTDCRSLEAEFNSNSEVSVDGQTSPTDINLSNPLSLTAIIGTDSVRYTLIAYYSNLPIVYINTPAPIESKDDWVKKCTIRIANAGEGNVQFEKVQMKGRGNTTWSFPKKPYAIKLDKKSEVLGMAKHKRWCLLANWLDRTNIRNDVMLEIGNRLTGLEWTPSGKFVDLVFNGKFEGTYYLCEQIKVDPNRVDITEMTNLDISGVSLTGGYLIELDKNFDEVNKFRSKILDFPVNFKDPDEEILQPAQFAYMENYFNEVEFKLTNHADWAEIEALLDIDSFIDWWLLYEIAGTWEPCGPKSCFMYKKRNGKLYAGPGWDFDWGTFRVNSGWTVREAVWYPYLDKYPEYVTRVKERWSLAKLSLATIPEYIQSVSKSIAQSAEYDSKLWPINMVVNFDEQLTYQESIEKLLRIYQERMVWIDRNIQALTVN